MTHIWLEDRETGWIVALLQRAAYCLIGCGVRLLAGGPRDESTFAPGTTILRTAGDSGDARVLLTTPQDGALVNGSAVSLGIRVLSDRDEISIADIGAGFGRRFYYSTERLAKIEPLPADVAATCPRCHDPILPGEPSVRCPSRTCGIWHHEKQGRPCWSYGERCAACQKQSTDFDANFQFSPEDL